MAIELTKAGNCIARFFSPQARLKRPGIRLFDSSVLPEKDRVPPMGSAAPFDAVMAVVDLQKLRVTPLVNPLISHGFHYSRGAREAGIGKSVFDYMKMEGTAVMATPGNSNLFTNIGYWAWVGGQLHTHFQEVLAGPQNALVIGQDGVAIRAVEPHTLKSEVSALGGVRIVGDGKTMALDQIDPNTGRPTFLDAFGDVQHIFRRLPEVIQTTIKRLCLDRTEEHFDETQLAGLDIFRRFFPDWGTYKYSRVQTLPLPIRQMLAGEITDLDISPFTSLPEDLFGYRRIEEVKDFGDLSLSGTTVRARIPKSTLNHLLACTTDDRERLIIFGTFDKDRPSKEPVRKGILYEDTGSLAVAFAKQIGLEIKDALVLCNGSEPLIWTSDYEIASYDGINRKLTTALLFTEK